MDWEKEYKRLRGRIKNAYLYVQTDSTNCKEVLKRFKESHE